MFPKSSVSTILSYCYCTQMYVPLSCVIIMTHTCTTALVIHANASFKPAGYSTIRKKHTHNDSFSVTSGKSEQVKRESNSQTEAQFWPKKFHFVITGDFNMRIDNLEDHDDNVFTNSLGLDQYIHFQTHNQGNTVDLIFMDCFSKVNITGCIQGPYISDHCSLTCITSLKKSDIER